MAAYEIVIDQNATAQSLSVEEKSKFALKAEGVYRIVTGPTFAADQVIDPSSVIDNQAPIIWTSPTILNAEECRSWIDRVEATDLETGDFIFKFGPAGYERAPTGGRRLSQTKLITDEAFSEKVNAIFKNSKALPRVLEDGRRFIRTRNEFLITKYVPGCYFAPHFDGNAFSEAGFVSMYTAVLYLSNDFEGGATHYLPGEGSDVTQHIAVKPDIGHAVIHRARTAIHAAGEVLSGVKYVMQFALLYEHREGDAVEELRWAV